MTTSGTINLLSPTSTDSKRSPSILLLFFINFLEQQTQSPQSVVLLFGFLLLVYQKLFILVLIYSISYFKLVFALLVKELSQKLEVRPMFF